MTESEEILLSRVLAFKHQSHKLQPLLESALESPEAEPLVKNVCAKLSVGLVDHIDMACGILDISKRRFIELAITELLDKYESLTAEYDIFAPYEIQEGKTNV